MAFLKKLKAEATDEFSSTAWGASVSSSLAAYHVAASALGNVPRPRKTAAVDECDLYDVSLPTVEGLVVAKYTKQFGVAFTIAVKNVTVPADSFSTVKCPSGAVYQVTGSKLPRELAGSEKIALPRTVDREFRLMRLDGGLTIEVTKNKNSPGSGGAKDLNESEVPIGSLVRFTRVATKSEIATAKKSGFQYARAYSSAGAIEILQRGPTNARAALDGLFEGLRAGSDGFHHQTMSLVLDSVADRPEALCDLANVDALALATEFEARLELHRNKKVGVGKRWEHALFNAETPASWETNIAALRDETKRYVNLLNRLTTSALSNSHYAPIVQHPTTPSLNAASDRATSGVSFFTSAMMPGMPAAIDAESPYKDTRFFCEAVLTPAADKRRRSTPTAADPDPKGRTASEIVSETMGAVQFDAAAFSYGFRNPTTGDLEMHVAKLPDGTSIGVKSCVDSCKTGRLPNLLGVYDFARFWSIQNELASVVGLIFPSTWTGAPAPVGCEPFQPQIDSDYGDYDIPPIFDIASAVENGVRVSREFVMAHGVDQDVGTFRHPVPTPIQLVLETKGSYGAAGVAIPPKPLKIDSGVQCMNGTENSLMGSLSQKRLPEGVKETDLSFFVIYEGALADTLANPKINTDTAAGEAHLDTKFKQDLDAELANTCAIYVTSPAPEPVAPLKKRKVDTSD